MAIYWPTPGYKGRTFKLCVLNRWDSKFLRPQLPTMWLEWKNKSVTALLHVYKYQCAHTGICKMIHEGLHGLMTTDLLTSFLLEHIVTSSLVVAFSSLAMILGNGLMFHSPSTLFIYYHVFKVEISLLTHQFHFLRQDKSTVAQWAEMTTVAQWLTSCEWACFPDRFPHYA